MFFAALCAGCQGAAANQNTPEAEARVDGAHLVLAANSPHLPALMVASAVPDSAASVSLNGRLTWNEDVTVRVFSPFAGRVTRILRDVGEEVRPGDALALIAAPDFGQAQADARRAATDLALAERTLARQVDLLQHGVVARKEVEQAEADVARARADHQRAKVRLELYGGDTALVDQLLPLKTPLGGWIVDRSITPGQEVRADQMLANAPQLVAPLFVVTDPSRLWVMLDVPERELPLVREGAALVVHAQAWPDRTFRGRVTRIAGAMDPSTRTLKVRGTVGNADGRLKGEMLVTIDLSQPPVSGVAVPASAVLLSGDSHVVFVEEQPGSYERRVVRVGAPSGGMVPVLAGLRSGERVVIGSTLLLEQLFRTTART